jgi:histidinol-phosphate aminotransferase
MARSTFNVNALGQVVAFAALQDEKHMKNIVSKTIKERRRLFEGLLDLGSQPYPSEANFISAFTPLIATQIVESLAEKQILISRIYAVGFEKCIRVTFGNQNNTDAFLLEMSELLKRT